MLIIVEGCDLAGKTTFVEKLRQEIHRVDPGIVTTLHRGPPRRHVLEEYEYELSHYVPGAGHFICDRWHIGEMVYGPILRGTSKLDPAMFMHVDMFLKSKGALIVHLDPGIIEIKRRYRKRGDDLVKFGHLRRIHMGYTGIFTQHPPHMDTDGNDKSVQLIVKYAQELEADAYGIHSTYASTYVGPKDPDILLVGDRRGDRAGVDHPLYPAAFVPYPETSGHFLFECLTPAYRHGKTFGVFNVCETDEEATRVTCSATRSYPVALGQSAHHALTTRGVEHGVVPHPQYVRRFHRAKWLRYHDAILHAARMGEDLSKGWS